MNQLDAQEQELAAKKAETIKYLSEIMIQILDDDSEGHFKDMDQVDINQMVRHLSLGIENLDAAVFQKEKQSKANLRWKVYNLCRDLKSIFSKIDNASTPDALFFTISALNKRKESHKIEPNKSKIIFDELRTQIGQITDLTVPPLDHLPYRSPSEFGSRFSPKPLTGEELERLKDSLSLIGIKLD